MASSEDAGADHVALLSDHRAIGSVSLLRAGWTELLLLLLLRVVVVVVVVGANPGQPDLPLSGSERARAPLLLNVVTRGGRSKPAGPAQNVEELEENYLGWWGEEGMSLMPADLDTSYFCTHLRISKRNP